jgi:hypothetical protein
LKRNFHWLGPGATFCWWYFWLVRM